MSLWALLLIRRSTFTFLSDVGHITHTCAQQKLDNLVVYALDHYHILLERQPMVRPNRQRRMHGSWQASMGVPIIPQLEACVENSQIGAKLTLIN